jgi:hypothetical protein
MQLIAKMSSQGTLVLLSEDELAAIRTVVMGFADAVVKSANPEVVAREIEKAIETAGTAGPARSAPPRRIGKNAADGRVCEFCGGKLPPGKKSNCGKPECKRAAKKRQNQRYNAARAKRVEERVARRQTGLRMPQTNPSDPFLSDDDRAELRARRLDVIKKSVARVG